MSTPSLIFSIYILIGLLLMTIAVAAPGKEKRSKTFDVLGGGGVFDAGLLTFIALLWPLWLVIFLIKKNPKV